MADTRREVDAALRGSSLFPLLDPEEQERFITAGRPRTWRAGSAICTLGDPGSSMMLVRTGLVRRPATPRPKGGRSSSRSSDRAQSSGRLPCWTAGRVRRT